MTYSTGRGGAGNMQNSTTITSENNELKNSVSPLPVTPSDSRDSNNNKKVFYSTGRGGAGNIKSSDTIPSPKLAPQGSSTPQLITSKVSTGRGGYGNMVDNKDPELTRKLQDVDGKSPSSDLYAVASNKSFSIGRGGFGNVISRTKSSNSQGTQGLADQTPNLYTISSHGNKKDKKGLLGKIKDIFN